jgi:acetyl-CoA carboxylase biotin carboxyl carrier protein
MTNPKVGSTHSIKDEAPISYAIEAPLSETGLSFAQIKELMTHMKKEGVTSFKFGEGKTRLSIRREKEVVYKGSPSDASFSYPLSSVASEEQDTVSGETVLPAPDTGYSVTSPVVGVFYDSPSPDDEPYVTAGSFVKKGEVLCIVEAMKLMNEVTSPVSGIVREILVQKASRVEYGQKLFIIDASISGDHENA